MSLFRKPGSLAAARRGFLGQQIWRGSAGAQRGCSQLDPAELVENRGLCIISLVRTRLAETQRMFQAQKKSFVFPRIFKKLLIERCMMVGGPRKICGCKPEKSSWANSLPLSRP